MYIGYCDRLRPLALRRGDEEEVLEEGEERRKLPLRLPRLLRAVLLPLLPLLLLLLRAVLLLLRLLLLLLLVRPPGDLVEPLMMPRPRLSDDLEEAWCVAGRWPPRRAFGEARRLRVEGLGLGLLLLLVPLLLPMLLLADVAGRRAECFTPSNAPLFARTGVADDACNKGERERGVGEGREGVGLLEGWHSLPMFDHAWCTTHQQGDCVVLSCQQLAFWQNSTFADKNPLSKDQPHQNKTCNHDHGNCCWRYCDSKHFARR